MDVSHFELVFKPQSPEGDAQTVLQGYFLAITNLEDKAYSYQLEFVTSVITDPDRSLANNTVVFVDTPNDNNQPGSFFLQSRQGGKLFRLNSAITVPAHGTALVAVLPSDPFAAPGSTPNFECRGFVKISLPPILVQIDGLTFSRLKKQSDSPVKVLLTPQNRATYLSTTGEIKDQTQSSVPTASGAALNEIEPDPAVFVLDGIIERDLDLVVGSLAETGRLPIDYLSKLLENVSENDADMKALEKAMNAQGLSLDLTKTKARSKSKREMADL